MDYIWGLSSIMIKRSMIRSAPPRGGDTWDWDGPEILYPNEIISFSWQTGEPFTYINNDVYTPNDVEIFQGTIVKGLPDIGVVIGFTDTVDIGIGFTNQPVNVVARLRRTTGLDPKPEFFIDYGAGALPASVELAGLPEDSWSNQIINDPSWDYPTKIQLDAVEVTINLNEMIGSSVQLAEIQIEIDSFGNI